MGYDFQKPHFFLRSDTTRDKQYLSLRDSSFTGGSEWEGGPFVGCRLKFSYFVGSQLKFSIFVGSRLNFLIFVGYPKISVNK